MSDIAREAEDVLRPCFARFERTSEAATRRITDAFRRHRLSETHFAATTGYGYDDIGRDTLDRVYADVFGAEDALVRIQFVSGTHAIACALFGALRPGQTLLSAVGAPYDTLHGVIGLGAEKTGSLAEYGILYRQVDPLESGAPDMEGLKHALQEEKSIGAVLIQRSRGYSDRQSLSIDTIRAMADMVHSLSPEIAVVTDNCYGEFVAPEEPCMAGADLVAGSLIKNPGGGLAHTGGYIAGRSDLVARAAYRLTAPGIGRECGPSLGFSRQLFQGLFIAPHTVCQALKTAAFCAYVMDKIGYEVSPGPLDERHDIIQRIVFGDPQKLELFCQSIQFASPVDAFVRPEPWQMPGYDCPVIMAAGTFVQGASIELSADAPMRPPFAAFLQGGLSYESGKLAILTAVQNLLA